MAPISADIGAIEYVFERGKHFHPDMWSVFSWNEAVVKVSKMQSSSTICVFAKNVWPPKYEIDCKSTYRALKKKSSQTKTGRTGRKNCLVTGIKSAPINSVAAPVFTMGPGAWLTESEKIVRITKIKYFPS